MSKSEAKAFIDLSDKILAGNWIDLFQCLFKKKKKPNLDHFVSVYVVQKQKEDMLVLNDIINHCLQDNCI